MKQHTPLIHQVSRCTSYKDRPAMLGGLMLATRHIRTGRHRRFAQRAHLLLGLEVRRRSAGARGARRFALGGLLGCALGALALAADAETLCARLGLVGRVRACAAAASAALGKALFARSLADRLLRARARLGDLKSNCAKRNAAGTAGKVCRLLSTSIQAVYPWTCRHMHD